MSTDPTDDLVYELWSACSALACSQPDEHAGVPSFDACPQCIAALLAKARREAIEECALTIPPSDPHRTIRRRNIRALALPPEGD